MVPPPPSLSLSSLLLSFALFLSACLLPLDLPLCLSMSVLSVCSFSLSACVSLSLSLQLSLSPIISSPQPDCLLQQLHSINVFQKLHSLWWVHAPLTKIIRRVHVIASPIVLHKPFHITSYAKISILLPVFSFTREFYTTYIEIPVITHLSIDQDGGGLDDGMTWKYFPHYWPFMKGIQQ